MNRKALVRLAAALALAAAAPLAAQHALEIIPLRHRTADQVLPALRPLLEPGATLSGTGNQLIVRTSPANLSDLRLALEALDRPARRLQISVRFDGSRAAAYGRVEAAGSVSERGSRFALRAEESRSGSVERVDQRVQVLEGGRAIITSGRSRPVRQRIHTPGGVVSQEVVVVHDQATGFEVVPRLSGRGVQLDIAGQAGAQHTATQVEIPLGQWVELAGTSTQATYRSELQGVWLKVEALEN
jgi:type II secretory pathway component GspD/PulD (secretin)